MSDRLFGLRTASAVAGPEPDDKLGLPVKRNRLYSQFAMYRYIAISAILSFGLAYVFHSNHDKPLGYSIVLLHVVLYGCFYVVTKKVVIVDDPATLAARANTSMIGAWMGATLVWALVVLTALVVVSNQEIGPLMALSLMMGVAVMATVSWRALKNAKATYRPN